MFSLFPAGVLFSAVRLVFFFCCEAVFAGVGVTLLHHLCVWLQRLFHLRYKSARLGFRHGVTVPYFSDCTIGVSVRDFFVVFKSGLMLRYLHFYSYDVTPIHTAPLCRSPLFICKSNRLLEFFGVRAVFLAFRFLYIATICRLPNTSGIVRMS